MGAVNIYRRFLICALIITICHENVTISFFLTLAFLLFFSKINIFALTFFLPVQLLLSHETVTPAYITVVCQNWQPNTDDFLPLYIFCHMDQSCRKYSMITHLLHSSTSQDHVNNFFLQQAQSFQCSPTHSTEQEKKGLLTGFKSRCLTSLNDK